MMSPNASSTLYAQILSVRYFLKTQIENMEPQDEPELSLKMTVARNLIDGIADDLGKREAE